ncbi:MAG: VTT domain-containing protein [Pseudomonadota bacterium]
MLERAYAWIVSFASHPRAVWVLALISFAESSIFPLPPTPLLIPMGLARPDKSWYYATVCAAASALGGIVGYAIGYLLWDTVGQWVIETYGMAEQAQNLRAQASHYWFWILITKGLTPIPFKLVTIMSGLIGYNFWLFMLASIISRFVFFYMFALALYYYGSQIRTFMETHLRTATFILLFFLIGGFFLVKYIV